MTDVTRILSQVEHGDQSAADQLLPLVYDELRSLAAARLAGEKPGQTLLATALVHEAYLRLVGADVPQQWDSRGHFFSAAAEAMRRILVERARKKNRIKHGGLLNRVDLDEAATWGEDAHEELIALDDALAKFATIDPKKAELVKLRYFAGLSIDATAELLKMSPRTAKRYWSYARAWLVAELNDPD